ncbi:hypothetical protein [Brevundimonas sp.]|uniref:hypothetical protein n=1 Tax=Brevundimonas sp. TaxID=1871086 RepID=UPI0035B418F7
MDAQGQWRLAKAYDLFGRSRPRALSRYRGGGGSRNPTRAQVHGLGRRHSLSNRLIDVIIDEVRAAVADWPRAAEDAGVTRASRAGRPPGGRHDVPDLVCRPTG